MPTSLSPYRTAGDSPAVASDGRSLNWGCKATPCATLRVSICLPSVTSITVKDLTGKNLLTSRDTDRDIKVKLPSVSCLEDAFRNCAFFDSGPADWDPTGLVSVDSTWDTLTCRTPHLTDFVVYSTPRPSPSPVPPPPPFQPTIWGTLLICWGGYVMLQVIDPSMRLRPQALVTYPPPPPNPLLT